MSKIHILLFILLFTFCASDEKNEFINEANKIIECVREYDTSLLGFPDASVNSSEVAFNITNYTDGTYGLIDEALASCGY